MRALADMRLSALHLRALGIIAHRDRMSLVTGKGQGCWASSQTMAAEIGVNVTNMSTAINQLFRWGYLVAEPLATDKRKRAYRVVFDGGDAPEIVCPVGKEDDADILPQGQTKPGKESGDRLPTVTCSPKLYQS